ncbi:MULTISPECIES: CRISPR-associated helicase Cas3' [unclassified Shinella]|uniref:CRISPR-associated helicase Cas3' n=2 Tax=Shinella TaxID=323620 RepID=UPI00234E94FC|nr:MULTISPECIES: CRISPR-associated helicase Cas3' [unclassified Shinella]MCO5153542.1 CRISPR-associated helicase Cas3' [Shinella sp.]MDC7265785.1 CRISPR-associated helicase Cas3' [Shinella sp. HY16]MDC7272682.1 CRISPR-associated helicase Cas3' [Shinella sp. YZ44]
MSWYAHSTADQSKVDWQLLSEHCFGVAVLAAEMAKPLCLERAAFFAGLFHDLGKYCIDFQLRLEGRDVPVDHSTAGAQVLSGLAQGSDKLVAHLLAYAILGHHAGLPDWLNETDACCNMRLKRPLALDPAWQDELRPEVSDLLPDMVAQLAKTPPEQAFAFAFMTRMIFSCLVDADFKDTERYYSARGDVVPDRDWPALQDRLDDFLSRFEVHMAKLNAGGSELNDLRAAILAHVRAGAERQPGLFTLTVPTGGGKTLASLAFALDHARRHGHTRIIYAIPFTSIIDQTAAIFRDVLGEENILEHHAAIDEERLDSKERKEKEAKEKLRLAMEDWAAPVVVTTTVQLFESLFSARPSKARKLHNIANAVIILDEAQTLPRGLLLPILRALEELATHYGCTVVLCTATQPALERREAFPKGLPLAGRELAPDPPGLAQKFARVRIRHGGDMDNDALIAALRDREQVLVIVNSRRHALELFQQAQREGLGGLVHLTTRHHAADRRRILEDIRARLKAHAPCRLIATSLIEAGVDVDFPVALRAEAGLDQIIQAAGRVNREGRRRRGESIVTVFKAPDYPPPAEIRGLVGDMKRIIDRHDDLTSTAAIEDYFGEVYWRFGAKGLDAKGILDRFTLSRQGSNFAFRTVGDTFRMIESGMAPVIIASEAEAQKAVDQLSIEGIPSRKLARNLQPFVVQVPPKARDVLIRNGHAAFAAPALRGDQFVVLHKMEFYRPDVGLIWENADYLAAEDMLI